MKKEIINGKEKALPASSIKEGKNYASKEEVVEALEEAYARNPELHQRLLYFTLKTIRITCYDSSLHNITADDVVQTVIEKILKQKRKWYKGTTPDFLHFVRICIISHIRNQCKKKIMEEPEDLMTEDAESANVREVMKSYARKDIGEDNNHEKFEALIEQFEEALGDDVNAIFVLEERLEGNRSNKEIARSLGLDVRSVENALKRIKTRLHRFLKPEKSPVGKHRK